MTDPANQSNREIDSRLASWLREAADCKPSGIADPVARTRAMLLKRLDAASPVQPANVRNAQAKRLSGIWARHRLAVGGVAASIALAGALLMALNFGAQLSAMERVAKELQGVKSYSFRSAGTNTGIDNDGKRETIKDDHTVYWAAPAAYRQETKIVKIAEDAGGGNRTEETLAHFDEIFPPGKPGLFIDHHRKTFVRVPSEPIGTYVWDDLRMIREGSYDVLGDLGTKRIGETRVQGYRLALKNPHHQNPVWIMQLRDPVELWVDPETNLPVEYRHAGTIEGWKYTDQATDFRWNIALDPKWFEPVIPQGYDDITPPSEESDLDQIAAALRLYAQLSGGRYPQTKTIDPSAIRDEMLKMADSSPADPQAARDKTREQIDQSMPGLNWIARILRNRLVSGYRGSEVGPADKDKVLLWWNASNDRYHVFYGDLRTEVLTLTEQEWSKLVPKEEVVDKREND